MDVPSPFSISGMGATLFLACWRVASTELDLAGCAKSLEHTSPELPWMMSLPSMGPLSLDPSPLRGMLCDLSEDWRYEIGL